MCHENLLKNFFIDVKPHSTDFTNLMKMKLINSLIGKVNLDENTSVYPFFEFF